MKFSEKVQLFLDELEANTVALVEGVSIGVVRERWLPIIRQLENGLVMAKEELVFGGNWEVARARIDALLAGSEDECLHPNAVSAVNEVVLSGRWCPDCQCLVA